MEKKRDLNNTISCDRELLRIKENKKKKKKKKQKVEKDFFGDDKEFLKMFEPKEKTGKKRERTNNAFSKAFKIDAENRKKKQKIYKKIENKQIVGRVNPKYLKKGFNRGTGGNLNHNKEKKLFSITKTIDLTQENVLPFESSLEFGDPSVLFPLKIIKKKKDFYQNRVVGLFWDLDIFNVVLEFPIIRGVMEHVINCGSMFGNLVEKYAYGEFPLQMDEKKGMKDNVGRLFFEYGFTVEKGAKMHDFQYKQKILFDMFWFSSKMRRENKKVSIFLITDREFNPRVFSEMKNIDEDWKIFFVRRKEPKDLGKKCDYFLTWEKMIGLDINKLREMGKKEIEKKSSFNV